MEKGNNRSYHTAYPINVFYNQFGNKLGVCDFT